MEPDTLKTYPTSYESPMRLRSRKFVIGSLLLLLAAAVPYGLYRWQSSQADYDLTTIVAELDRTAAPWRLADLAARRKLIPDERNAGIALRKARLPNLWKLFPGLEEFDRPPWQELPPALLIKMREGFDVAHENVLEARRLDEFVEGRFDVKQAP